MQRRRHAALRRQQRQKTSMRSGIASRGHRRLPARGTARSDGAVVARRIMPRKATRGGAEMGSPAASVGATAAAATSPPRTTLTQHERTWARIAKYCTGGGRRAGVEPAPAGSIRTRAPRHAGGGEAAANATLRAASRAASDASTGEARVTQSRSPIVSGACSARRLGGAPGGGAARSRSTAQSITARGRPSQINTKPDAGVEARRSRGRWHPHRSLRREGQGVQRLS